MITASDRIRLRLKALAKEKEHVRRALVITAKKLSIKAKKLAVTAKEKETVRRTLVITAKKLRIKAKALAVTAGEKETVRRTLVVTAAKLKKSYEGLEQKVRDRTQELEEAKNRDEAILTSIGDAVMSCDKSGRIVLFNTVAEQLTGFSTGEAIGRRYNTVFTLIRENDGTSTTDFIADIIKTGHVKQMENHMLLVTKEGTTLPVANSAAPVKDVKGNITGCVIVFRDVTREKNIDKAKTEFMSFASHQLRTPLTEIRWALSSLKRESLTEDQKNTVFAAHEAVVHMAETIKKMLTLSHLEMDSMEQEIVAVDVHTVIDKIARLSDAHRQRKKLTLVVECPDSLRIPTDELLLIEILSNLLSNAYKYTPNGGTVTIRAAEEDAHVRIDVTDTGYGIPLDEQGKVVGKFFRASNVAQREEQGSGLGLYMVYALVKLLGAEVSFVSKENKGTTFTLFFPL